MKYLMKSGVLSCGGKEQALVRGALMGPEKKIYAADGTFLMEAEIRDWSAAGRKERGGTPSAGEKTKIRRRYLLWDSEGKECAFAVPEYAAGEDPAVAGWPRCRLPRIDRARLDALDQKYCLIMRDSGHYSLETEDGAVWIRVSHRGLDGGWDIEADGRFSPAFLCGVFIFCRYIEQENEFLIV